MKDAILIELVNRWQTEASTKIDKCVEDSPAGMAIEAGQKAERETLRRCADTLRTLIGLLGEQAS